MFDFDGVIVDSFRLSYESMKTVVDNPPDEEGYRRWFDGNIYDNEEYGSKYKYKEDSYASGDDPFFKTYIPLLLKIEPVGGIIDAIKELHKNHRLVVVSSTINSPIKAYLDKHNLSQRFDKIYGADVHTNKVTKIKMVFTDFSVTARDCLFITDTLGDMRESAKAGVKSIGVTWGFHNLEALQKGNPIAIANTPQELISFLKKQG